MISLVFETKEQFSSLYKKIVDAFPYEERRDECDEQKCFLKEQFNFCEITDDGKSVGVVVFWTFKSFLFIEHIAINNEVRGKGYGSKVIEIIKEMYNLPIILEAEAPETEIQKKRIKFYEKLGFKVNFYNYIQPSYHDAEGVSLQILSFPDKLNENEFLNFVKMTKEVVYK